MANPNPHYYVDIAQYSEHFNKDFENDYLYFILYYDDNGTHCSNFFCWENVNNGFSLAYDDGDVEAFYLRGDAYNYFSTCTTEDTFSYETGSDTIPHKFTYDASTGVITLYSSDDSVRWVSPAGLGFETNADTIEPAVTWEVTEDGLISTTFPHSPDRMTEPYPLQYWRISALAHNGRPYHELLPDIKHINPTPVNERPVDDYICVFDMETKQTEFTGHGLAILCPTVCEITEELNSGYNLIMEHPKDPDGKWEYLREWNIIKARGQLFVINKIKDNWQNKKGSITVWAEHITYTLQDSWLFPGATVSAMTPVTAVGLIYAIMMLANEGWDTSGSRYTYYNFTADSDVEVPADFHDWDSLESGATPYAMLLGSNGFISKFGGELYRDNFYFSINQRMENSADDAFELRVGRNLCGINKTIDLSTAAFYFRMYDQFGWYWSVSWDESTLPRAFPRTVVRSQKVTLPFDNPDQYSFDMLYRMCCDYFGRYCAPLISYEVTIKDLRRNPDYKMFQNTDRFKVGDKGRVYDTDLGGYVTLEISRTVTNAITGEVTEVTFGSVRSFTRPNTYNPIVSNVFTPVLVGGEIPLQDSEGFMLQDSEGYDLYEEIKIEQEE